MRQLLAAQHIRPATQFSFLQSALTLQACPSSRGLSHVLVIWRQVTPSTQLLSVVQVERQEGLLGLHR